MLLSRRFVLAALALLAGCSARTPVSTADAPPSTSPLIVPAGDTSRVLRLRVHSRALEGNLLGDSADRNVVVYLPADYATSGAKRYRTLYLLHGFGARRNGQNAWVTGYKGFHLGHTMDSLGAAGAVRDLIVVAPDGGNYWGGSFWRDSPVAGGWETFVVRDLVSAIDASFRTVASRDARGIAGHSMGGFGTLTIAAKHPDVFGAAYALSACCIAPDTARPTSLAPIFKAMARNMPRDTMRARTGFYGGVMMGLATAYSPNASRGPLLVNPPFRLEGDSLVADNAVGDQWRAGSPLRLADSLSANLASLRAFGFDAGRADNFKDIPVLSQRLDELLTRKGVAHRFELHDGDHNNRIGERMITVVLPFFSNALAR